MAICNKCSSDVVGMLPTDKAKFLHGEQDKTGCGRSMVCGPLIHVEEELQKTLPLPRQIKNDLTKTD